jgi:hypothetical protein
LRSRNNPRSNRILFVTAESIAGKNAVDLAMLFLHAGFSVFFIMLPGSEKWLGINSVSSITKPWVAGSKPGWTKSRHGFDLTFFFDTHDELINQLLSGSCSDELTSFILSKCSNFNFLLHAERPISNIWKKTDPRYRFFAMPDKPTNLPGFFYSLLSQSIRLLAGRKKTRRHKCYLEPQLLANSEFSSNLAQALFYNGFCFGDAASATIHIKKYEAGSPEEAGKLIVYPESGLCKEGQAKGPEQNNAMFVTSWKSGLQILWKNQTRIIPDIEGQHSLNRLAELITFEILHNSDFKQ